jgi:hypothetical protein
MPSESDCRIWAWLSRRRNTPGFKFKLDVSQIHYDITSVELFGAYEIETNQIEGLETFKLGKASPRGGG